MINNKEAFYKKKKKKWNWIKLIMYLFLFQLKKEKKKQILENDTIQTKEVLAQSDIKNIVL